jgi:hypothetical protein
MDGRMDAGYRMLDDQLVDVEGRRCGRVDDLEFEGAPGEPLVLTGILTGRGAYHRRLPRRLQRIGRRIFGDDVRGPTVRRVPWEEVEDVTVRVELRKKAADLGLVAR